MNTSGGRVSEVLTRHDGYRAIWADHLPEELSDFDAFVEEGRLFRVELAEIVHETSEPREFDRASMRAWLQHGWKTDALVVDMARKLGLS
jgi:hypothetical protein